MKGKVILMTGMIAAILGLVGVCANVGEAAAEVGPAGEGTIVALGDSLTAGFGVKEKESYPVRLEKRLHESGHRWRVINSGVCGETSGDVLARIDEVLKLRPDIVILEIGVNDAFRGIEPRLIQMNIDETVRILKSRGITVVLTGMRTPTGSASGYNEGFAAIYPAVAMEHGLILVPFFLAGVAGDPSLNKADGIHPVAKGYRIVAETVYPYVLRAIDGKREK
ncbi:MAG TPA: arylesterase [Geobacteraceae bacterium]